MLRKNRLFTILLLVALILSACQPIQPQVAGEARTAKGDIHFMVPAWGNLAISIHFDVREINPQTHEASGPVNWTIYSPTSQEGGTGWRAIDSQAKYALFGAEIPGADPDTVVVISQITARRGWGQGEPGEYAYFWFKDSGQPTGDQWGNISYKIDPWIEFYPADDPPVLTDYITVEQLKQNDPNLPITVEMGDVQILKTAETESKMTAAITGNMDFAVPDWGLQHGWFDFNVASPKTAKDAPIGWVRWVEVNADDELRYVMADAHCVSFSADGKSALLTLQITSRRGWGEGEAGQWMHLWLHDGGSPGAGKDAFGTPFWPPQDQNPDCDYIEPAANINTATGGDLIIQP